MLAHIGGTIFAPEISSPCADARDSEPARIHYPRKLFIAVMDSVAPGPDDIVTGMFVIIGAQTEISISIFHDPDGSAHFKFRIGHISSVIGLYFIAIHADDGCLLPVFSGISEKLQPNTSQIRSMSVAVVLYSDLIVFSPDISYPWLMSYLRTRIIVIRPHCHNATTRYLAMDPDMFEISAELWRQVAMGNVRK